MRDATEVARPATIRSAVIREMISAAKRAPKRESGRRWEGVLDGDYGKAKGFSFSTVMTLVFHCGVVEGCGKIGDATDLVLSGSQGPEGLAFDLWIKCEDVERTPFQCEAQLLAGGALIEGRWRNACFYPETCGCEGGGGSLRLTRLG